MNLTSVRAVAARLDLDADGLAHVSRDLIVPSLEAATTAELGRVGAAWIGFLTETRDAVQATAGALRRVCLVFEDADTHAELPRPDGWPR